MKYLRTPDHFFKDLEDYPFEPHYLNLDNDLRMHYVDEGNGELVLLLHGEPSWSYLYRKMIPVLVKAGFRIIAPDLIGFGKSDKPTEKSDYSYAGHLEWLNNFMVKLELENINLFCQDWGGLLGLRLAAEYPEKFTRIIAANTFLPTGQNPPNKAFTKWREFALNVPEFPVSAVLNMATSTALSSNVLKAYDAPFPDETYKAGARIFPALVPLDPDDPESQNNIEAWKNLAQWEKPFLTLFSDSDPIMNGLEKIFQKKIPGAAGQAHTIIKGAGHFLQEDKGAEIAQHVAAFIKNTSIPAS